MERKRSLHSKLGIVLAVLVLLLLIVPVSQDDQASAGSSNPCSSLPRVCRYQWDPAEHCCVADPRFDCFDVCY